MTETLKILGQQCPTANSPVTLYTVPGATSAVTSALAICNQNSTSVKVRVWIAVGGASLNTKQYICYDTRIPPNMPPIEVMHGVPLATTDVVKVQADTANVSFNLSGSELT